MLEYVRERRYGEELVVDAMGVRRRPRIKCKDRVLKFLRKRRYGEVWRVDAVDVRGGPPIKM